MSKPPYLTVSLLETPFGGGSCRGSAVEVGFSSIAIVVKKIYVGGFEMVTLGSVRGATESFKTSRLVTTSSAESCWPSPVMLSYPLTYHLEPQVSVRLS